MTYEEQPASGEGTLIAFFERMAEEIDDLGREILNHIAQALLERGWVPTLDATVEQLAEIRSKEAVQAGVAELERRRLLTLNESRDRIATILGSVSLERTAHMVSFDSGIDMYMVGGMELLASAPLFGMPVKARTVCPVTSKTIALEIGDDGIREAEPAGIAGFQCSWDGQSDLGDVFRQSHLFFDDDSLDKWVSEHSDIDGLPLSGDLLLFVGMGMTQESANARYRLIGL